MPVRIFRYLPPSPNETRAFYVLAFGSFVGQFVAFAFALGAPSAMQGAVAVAVGGGLAILARFFGATWAFDSRRRRARNGRIELESDGVRYFNENGQATFVRWDEITKADTKNGRLQLEFRGKKWSFGAREVENGMALTQEITRRVAKPQSKSNFIPLEPM